MITFHCFPFIGCVTYLKYDYEEHRCEDALVDGHEEAAEPETGGFRGKLKFCDVEVALFQHFLFCFSEKCWFSTAFH